MRSSSIFRSWMLCREAEDSNGLVAPSSGWVVDFESATGDFDKVSGDLLVSSKGSLVVL